jgi:hypothetical protein
VRYSQTSPPSPSSSLVVLPMVTISLLRRTHGCRRAPMVLVPKSATFWSTASRLFERVCSSRPAAFLSIYCEQCLVSPSNVSSAAVVLVQAVLRPSSSILPSCSSLSARSPARCCSCSSCVHPCCHQDLMLSRDGLFLVVSLQVQSSNPASGEAPTFFIIISLTTDRRADGTMGCPDLSMRR